MKPYLIAAIGLVILVVAGVALAAMLPNGEWAPEGDSAADSLRQVRLREQASADFQAIAAAYRDTQRLAIQVEHRVYASHESREAIELERSTLRRSGRYLYNDAFGSAAIITDSLLVQIDQEDRQILVSRTNGMTPDSIVASALSIEASLEYCDSVGYVELDGGRGEYIMWYGEGSEVQRLDVRFSRSSGFVERVTLFMGIMEDEIEESAPVAPRIEIVYNHLDPSSIDEKVFREEEYLRWNDRVLVPAPRYEEYELIDLRMGGAR